MLSSVERTAREARKGRLESSKMRPPGPQDEAQMVSRRAPWRRLGGLGLVLGASWRAPGGSWSRLGGSWAAPGASRGAPGLIWASRGARFGAFWASVEASLAKARKPRTSTKVKHFLLFFEVPGPPESLQNRLPEASWGCLKPLWPLRGPSAWLLGRPWVAPDRSRRTATRGTYMTSSPKIV